MQTVSFSEREKKMMVSKSQELFSQQKEVPSYTDEEILKFVKYNNRKRGVSKTAIVNVRKQANA